MKYDYVVKPKVPVRGLPAEKTFNRPSNVSFEKEDVLTYLRFGNVYRKFSIDDLVKVQRDNIDQLHVSAEEYYGKVSPAVEKLDPGTDTTIVSNENTPVVETKPNVVKFGEPIPTPVVEEKTEPIKEEVVEETSENDVVLIKADEDGGLDEPAEQIEEVAETASDLNEVDNVEEPVAPVIEESVTAEQEVANTEVNVNRTSISREVLENMVENAESEGNSSYTPVLSNPVEASEEVVEDVSEENPSDSIEETEKTENRPQNGNNNYSQYHKKKKR